MALVIRFAWGALLAFTALSLLAGGATPAWADLFLLAASGTVSINSTSDATIPAGTPWAFQLTYNTTAPDVDFELVGSPSPTFGKFTNTTAPPAIVFFHYQAGEYEVTIDDPADFGEFSEIIITFTEVHAIDINIRAPDSFPPLAGGPVSFHADFNAFEKAPVLTSDGLPTDAALSQASFDESAVSLLPPAGVVSGSVITSFSITDVPDINADFDGDGHVDGDDLVRWRAGFGEGSSPAQGNADGDADVDGADLLAWQRELAIAPVVVAASAVPEPACSMLAWIGAIGGCRAARRRRRIA